MAFSHSPPTDHVLDDSACTASHWLLTGVLRNGDRFCQIRISEEPFRIGRHPSSDLVLSLSTVSKEHAEVLAIGEAVFVQDLGSTNGTYVNGCKIRSMTPLGRGDRIQIADVTFEIERSPADQAVQDTSTSATELALDQWIPLSFDDLLTDGGLYMVFQPVVTIDSRRVVGFEALARSNVIGLNSAAELFQLAARFKMESRLSHMCRILAGATADRLPGSPEIFLNTCAEEIPNEHLLSSLRILRDAFPDLRVVLEMNEKCVTLPQAIVPFHRQLRELNIGLAFDDFGSGQSRLGELTRIQPDYIKFDRSLIQNLPGGGDDIRTFVTSLVKTVRELGIEPIAEGVESQDCLAVCRDLGFTLCQGFHLGRPAPVDEWIPPQPKDHDTIQDIPVWDDWSE